MQPLIGSCFLLNDHNVFVCLKFFQNKKKLMGKPKQFQLQLSKNFFERVDYVLLITQKEGITLKLFYKEL